MQRSCAIGTPRSLLRVGPDCLGDLAKIALSRTYPPLDPCMKTGHGKTVGTRGQAPWLAYASLPPCLPTSLSICLRLPLDGIFPLPRFHLSPSPPYGYVEISYICLYAPLLALLAAAFPVAGPVHRGGCDVGLANCMYHCAGLLFFTWIPPLLLPPPPP